MMILMLTIGFGDWQDNPSNGLTPFVVAHSKGSANTACLLVIIVMIIIMTNIVIMIMITVMKWSWLFSQEINKFHILMSH